MVGSHGRHQLRFFSIPAFRRPQDKFGQAQAKDLRERGLASHAEYGTYLLGDGDWPRIVAHLDGHDALNSTKFVRVVGNEGT
jgi:hypothetical protein